MGAEESDRQNSRLILNASNQPIVVSLDVEDNAAALEDARLRIRCLHILRMTPLYSKNRKYGGVRKLAGLFPAALKRKIRTPEHKTLPCNVFSHFAESALLIDFTPRPMLLFDIIALVAPTRSSETRMNTGFSPAGDGPKRAVTFLLTRARFS